MENWELQDTASVSPKVGVVIEAGQEIKAKIVAVGLQCYRSSSDPNDLFSWVVLSPKSD